MLAKTSIATAPPAATAVAGGLATRSAESHWYSRLRKSSYQPPRQAFPTIWALLYVDVAVSSALTRRADHRAVPALGAYLLWCTFATVLATHIWRLGRSAVTGGLAGVTGWFGCGEEWSGPGGPLGRYPAAGPATR